MQRSAFPALIATGQSPIMAPGFSNEWLTPVGIGTNPAETHCFLPNKMPSG
jgi:hypothetical protein